MYRFLISIFKWLIFLVVSLIAVQLLVDKGLQSSQSGFYNEWNEIFSGEMEYDLIIIGSSRAKKHYNSKLISTLTNLNCYNIGIDGGGALMQKTKWESYLKYNKAPKFLIQDIDMWGLKKRSEIFNKNQYLPYLNRPTVYNNLNKIDSYINVERIIPAIKYSGYFEEVFAGLKTYIKNKEVVDTYNGYIPLPNKTWHDETPINSGLFETKKNNDFSNLDILLDECEERNIQLILVYSPIYMDSTISKKNEFATNLKEYSKEKNIIFWDMSNVIGSNQKSMFYDHLHLNQQGSTLFTEILSDKLKSLTY